MRIAEGCSREHRVFSRHGTHGAVSEDCPRTEALSCNKGYTTIRFLQEATFQGSSGESHHCLSPGCL